MSVDQRVQWLLDARFGLFIHWGLYSILAGEWQEQRMDYIGEWIMSRFRIPVADYAKLAVKFNPQDFNADEWVQLAKQAGMRYIVITAKHHEGFAMYHSACDPYNIVDATPFGRDLLKELAEACARGGLKLGLYYSQDLDWHEPDGGYPPLGFTSNFGMSWGNDWDFPDNASKVYERYFEKKVKPQVRELLTNYGPIGLIWFDTPVTISPEQSDELYKLVRELQPDCLVNTRIGNGLGDYGSMGDNQVPDGHVEGAWETPATLNDTWGYKYFDNNWKSARDTLGVLAGLADKNVNYLLNIGPQPDGRFPPASVDILREIGRWMSINTEAMHGTRENPYPYTFDWGWITHRAASESLPAKLYLILKVWPQSPFTLQGLRTRVNKVHLHSSPDGEGPLTELTYSQSISSEADWLTIDLPTQPPSKVIPVVTLELDGDVNVDQRLIQQQGVITLPASCGRVQVISASAPEVDYTGILNGWFDPLDWIEWDVLIPKAGYYSVDVITSAVHHSRPWKGGHVIRIETDGIGVQARISSDEYDILPETRCYAQAMTHCGDAYFEHAGLQMLTLKALAIRHNDGVGLALVGLKLRPSV
jgi:alpha-L-fucosidase